LKGSKTVRRDPHHSVEGGFMYGRQRGDMRSPEADIQNKKFAKFTYRGLLTLDSVLTC